MLKTEQFNFYRTLVHPICKVFYWSSLPRWRSRVRIPVKQVMYFTDSQLLRRSSLSKCEVYQVQRGRRVIGISGSLIWSKTLMELIFNPWGEFRWSLEGPVSLIHSPHLLAGAPGIFSDLLKSVQMIKREWGAESNGKLPHLFIPNKSGVRGVVYSETKALCTKRNCIITFILTTLWYDAIMNLLKHKGWSVEAWLV